MNMDIVFNIVIVVFTVSNLAAMGPELNLRDAFELAVENVEGSVNIPVGQLRGRLDELPRDETIHVFCRSGQRSYDARRLLLQNGIDVKNISGGALSRTYASFYLREETRCVT
jgi:hypothetical protein